MNLFKEQPDWVLLFPGIGVKPFGGEREFFRKYREIVEPFLEQASEVVRTDLAGTLLNNTTFDNDQLCREVFAYAFSCGVFHVLTGLGCRPSLMAGHSMGIYAALASSGAISFDQGLKVTVKAHRLGSSCCGDTEFGAVVLIGLDPQAVQKILEEKQLSTVKLANYNNLISGVYAGCRDETDLLLTEADRRGAAKTIRLRIDIPFHNPLFMEEVSRRLHAFLETLEWHQPLCPIVSALDHSLSSSREELIRMTSANLAHPIHWPGVLRRLAELDVSTVIECGCGISLSQHARLIDSAPRHYNLKNLRRRLDY